MKDIGKDLEKKMDKQCEDFVIRIVTKYGGQIEEPEEFANDLVKELQDLQKTMIEIGEIYKKYKEIEKE
jgi:hypothetical protein